MAKNEMGKKDGFMDMLASGISPEEARSLTKKAQRNKALLKVPKINMSIMKSEEAKRFSDIWFSQRKTATIEQKDEVGLAFISKFLGLGDKIAQKFAEGDGKAYCSVGEKLSAMPIDVNTSNFWEKTREIFPDIYTEEDINFLASEGGTYAVQHLLEQLEVALAEESPVLRALSTVTHAYK